MTSPKSGDKAVATKRPAQRKPQNGKPQPAATPAVVDLDIRVDLAQVTFGDLEMAMGYEEGVTPIKELLPFLNRVIIGGVRHIPLIAMPQIMDALTEAFAGMGNPKN